MSLDDDAFMEKKTDSASPLFSCNSQAESNEIKHKHRGNQQLWGHGSAA